MQVVSIPKIRTSHLSVSGKYQNYQPAKPRADAQRKIVPKLCYAAKLYTPLFPFLERYGYTIREDLGQTDFELLFHSESASMNYREYDASRQRVNHLQFNYLLCKKSELLKKLADAPFLPPSFLVKAKIG